MAYSCSLFQAGEYWLQCLGPPWGLLSALRGSLSLASTSRWWMDLLSMLKFMLWNENLIHVAVYAELNRPNRKHGGLWTYASLLAVKLRDQRYLVLGRNAVSWAPPQTFWTRIWFRKALLLRVSDNLQPMKRRSLSISGPGHQLLGYGF